MPVTTTVPALRIAENAWATCSVLSTPVVTIAASAPWPLVTERAKSAASSIVANECVAPSFWAVSRLNSTGSTAMTWLAPACAAPCTALMPMPPMPMMITVWPGRTSPALTADPQPVPTPQPDEARLVEREVLVDLHAGRDVDDGVLAERRDPGALPDRLAVDAHAVRAVRAATGQHVGPEIAQVLHA